MRVLVMGGASCLWDDLRELGPWDGEIVAVNDAGWAYPHRIDHWVTAHPEHFADWEARRTGPTGYIRWSSNEHPRVDRMCRPWGPGSSGLLGVTVAVKYLHADEVVLCGIPMDVRPHFCRAEEWPHALLHQQAWTKNAHRMRGKVRSMSGWTKQLLEGT